MGSSSSSSKTPKPPSIEKPPPIPTESDINFVKAQIDYQKSREEDEMSLQKTVNPTSGYGSAEGTAMSKKPKKEKTLMSSGSKKKNSDDKKGYMVNEDEGLGLFY